MRNVFWAQPFSTRAQSDVSAAEAYNELKKTLSIFMPQTSINVFYIRRRRVLVCDREANQIRYACLPRAPTAYFYSNQYGASYRGVGIDLLSYCLWDINNKKISIPRQSCYCNKLQLLLDYKNAVMQGNEIVFILYCDSNAMFIFCLSSLLRRNQMKM